MGGLVSVRCSLVSVPCVRALGLGLPSLCPGSAHWSSPACCSSNVTSRGRIPGDRGTRGPKIARVPSRDLPPSALAWPLLLPYTRPTPEELPVPAPWVLGDPWLCALVPCPLESPGFPLIIQPTTCLPKPGSASFPPGGTRRHLTWQAGPLPLGLPSTQSVPAWPLASSPLKLLTGSPLARESCPRGFALLLLITLWATSQSLRH